MLKIIELYKDRDKLIYPNLEGDGVHRKMYDVWYRKGYVFSGCNDIRTIRSLENAVCLTLSYDRWKM